MLCNNYVPNQLTDQWLCCFQIEPVIDLQYKVDTMQKEMDNLRRQLVERER